MHLDAGKLKRLLVAADGGQRKRRRQSGFVELIGVPPGTQVGDLFMSLIHTCQLCAVNSFDYLVEVAAACRGTGGQPRGMDALELP